MTHLARAREPIAIASVAGLLIGVLVIWTAEILREEARGFVRAVPFLGAPAVLLALVLRERAVRKLQLLSPLVAACAVYIIMLCAVPLADLVFEHPMLDHRLWSRASWIVFLGAVSIALGYTVVAGNLDRQQRTVETEWNHRRATVLAGVLLAIATFFVLRSVGGIAGIPEFIANFANRSVEFNRSNSVRAQLVGSSVIIAMSLAAPAVLLLAGSWLRRRDGWSLGLLLAGLPLALVVSGFLGQRWRDVAIMVSLVGVFHYGRRRLPTWLLTSGAGLLLLLFIVWGQQRNVVGTRRVAPSISGTDFYYNYVGKTFEFAQFRDFVKTLGDGLETIGLQYGGTFLAIIPGAPFDTGGNLFSRAFYPLEYHHFGTSIPTPLPGELFLNFSYPGIFIGLAFYGAFLAFAEGMFHRHRRRTGAVLLYAISIFPPAILLRGDFVAFGGPYAIGVGALLLSLLLVERRRPEYRQ